MVIIAELDNPRAAQAYIDYMAIKHVRCQLVNTNSVYQVQLLDIGHHQLAQREWSLFVADPNADKYHQASWQRLDPQKRSFNSINSKSVLINNFLAHSGLVTLIIFILAAGIYCLYLLGLGNAIYGGLSFPQPMTLTQPWRFFSPALLHFSAIHIIFNLLWWWYLGGLIESKLGKFALLMLMLISALISNFGQYFATGPNFGGLSGVVYALMGFIWWSRLFKSQRGLLIPTPYINFMLIWLVFGFIEPFGMPIGNTAHLAGLISGCLLALLPIEKFLLCFKK